MALSLGRRTTWEAETETLICAAEDWVNPGWPIYSTQKDRAEFQQSSFILLRADVTSCETNPTLDSRPLT